MKVRHPVKLIVWLDIVVVVYIILAATIVQYRQEEKVSDIVIDSLKEWTRQSLSNRQAIIERERQLVSGIDEKLASRLKGSILIQVESRGEAWYVNPTDLKRYYLGRPLDALKLVSSFGVALDNEELFNYLYFDKVFPDSFAGKFVYDVNDKSATYYVHPESKIGYRINQSDTGLNVIAGQGMGISNENLRHIDVGEIK
jgi:hypothetical protein